MIYATEPAIAVDRETMGHLLEQYCYRGMTLRVLWGVMVYCEPGNYLHFSCAELARRLRMNYQVCLRAWQQLRRDGWLLVEQNALGRLVAYRVSPRLCWRGRPWKMRGAQAQCDAQQQLEALAQRYRAE